MEQIDPESDWTVAERFAALPEYRRIDEGADLLAFTLAGEVPDRLVYVYVYAPGRKSIGYDLEDWTRDTGEPDHAVERGIVTSIAELQDVCRRWLNPRHEP